MSDDPELERRLEAMFYSARPRDGFEAELWRRIGARRPRRPWQQRLGLLFRPALVFAPALAAVLVVALGVTWLAVNSHGGLSASSTTTSGGAPASKDQKALAPAPALGVLPPLTANHSAAAPRVTAGDFSGASGLNFSGTLPSLPSVQPVYRYDEPTAAQRVATAATLQAQSGLAVTVTPSDATAGVEAQFSTIAGPAPNESPGGPAGIANGFLSSHNLTPPFATQVTVAASGRQVIYDRLFDGPSGPIRQVRADGSAAGLTVDFVDSGASAKGPLDLPLTSAPYPLRSTAEALSATKVGRVSGSAALDHAELVYVLVVSGGHGYYEPELLLTGPGGYLLAPVVAAVWLGA